MSLHKQLNNKNFTIFIFLHLKLKKSIKFCSYILLSVSSIAWVKVIKRSKSPNNEY